MLCLSCLPPVDTSLDVAVIFPSSFRKITLKARIGGTPLLLAHALPSVGLLIPVKIGPDPGLPFPMH